MSEDKRKNRFQKEHIDRNNYWVDIMQKAKLDLGLDHIVIIESVGDSVGVHGDSDHPTALRIIDIVSERVAKPFLAKKDAKTEPTNPKDHPITEPNT